MSASAEFERDRDRTVGLFRVPRDLVAEVRHSTQAYAAAVEQIRIGVRQEVEKEAYCATVNDGPRPLAAGESVYMVAGKPTRFSLDLRRHARAVGDLARRAWGDVGERGLP